MPQKHPAKSKIASESRFRRGRLNQWLFGSTDIESPNRGRLMLESLESRQLMAGDVDFLSTGSGSDTNDRLTSFANENFIGQPEGEPAPDLVAFAKALSAAGVQFFGADWCPFCTEQKQLFEDGGDFLPFIEVTLPNRQLNPTGIAENIQTFPTWEFPDGTRATGVLSLATISQRSGVAIPSSETPSFRTIGAQTVLLGSPLHIPVDAYDPNGGPLTVTVNVDNTSLLDAVVLSGNRSIRIETAGYGNMVFQLFEDRAPVPAGRVIDLANANFYDGIIFHRVVDGFVIQAGDPTGTGTSGSSLPNFDDQFHPDLQHNRSGILSFAKTSDDTNNSQFFVTEVPTRHLDFNHSIFGQLTEGESVREGISRTAVNGSSKPNVDVRINTIDVFNDTENAVIMLKAKGTTGGTTNVRVTVSDSTGRTFSEVVPVTVVADTANSQPFLNAITTPAASRINTPATLQLSSVDVEGDAVTYFASTTSTNATATVNAATGLVTVTPANNFTGSVSVTVGVRPGAGVTGNSQSDSDVQTVSFRFEGESAVTTPTGIDLLATSDTGFSTTDNITNAGSLTFTVSGVTSGATVEIVRSDTNVVVGTGIATGNSINITTNNIASLGNGTYTLAARQTVSGTRSSLSPTISLVYDNTPPASIITSAITQANQGVAFVNNLINPEEGSGLRYALTTSPTGSTIDSTNGVINWTPTAAQIGNNNFTVELSDVAGNLRTETFAVNVGGIPRASIRLEVTDLQNNPISNVNVGTQFLLRMFGVDARGGFDRRGVFAAAADILFDSARIQPVAGSNIEYAPEFTVQRGGVISPGLIDELGAARTNTIPSEERESLIATIRMQAISAGAVNIKSEPAESVNSEVLLYLVDNRIPAERVGYGNVSLSIGQSFSLVPDRITVAEDSTPSMINVLSNDTVASGSGTITLDSVTQPSSGGTVAIVSGQLRFTPTPDFSGTAEFTYTASLAGAGSQTASVTVTVTPINDPPLGVADTFTVDQNSASQPLDVLANDTNPDSGETLTITRAVNSTAGATLSVNANGNRVNYQPPVGFSGVDTFTYTLSDGSSTRDVNVTVNVRSLDAPPNAVDDSPTVTEDATEASFNVTQNDTSDASNQAFTIVSVGTPSQGGVARASSDGLNLLYAPRADFNGTETVTYTIRDSGGGSDTATVTFTVTSVNDVPPSASPTRDVNRSSGETLIFSISDLPANVDSGETLTFTNVGTASRGGTVRIATNSTQIFYTPPSSTFTGNDTFTFTVRDSNNATSTGTITVRVNDFVPVDVIVSLPDQFNFSRNFLQLVGTSVLGQTVSEAATISDTGTMFDNVLPGDYTVSIPAIPFLQGGDVSRSIPVTVPTQTSATNLTISPEIGAIRAQFVSITDWFGSAPKKSILAAVSPGQSHTFAAVSSETDTITTPTLALDSSGVNLTITGRNASGSNVTASIPTTADRRVQVRGQVGNMQLIRVSVESSDVTFTPSTTTTSSTSSSGAVTSNAEGEQISTPSFRSSAMAVTSDAGSSNIMVGSQLSAPLSPASAAVSRTDVVVPTSLGSAEVEQSIAPEDDDAAKVDYAMTDVLPNLELRSETGDQLAAGETVLNAQAIDAVLGESL